MQFTWEAGNMVLDASHKKHKSALYFINQGINHGSTDCIISVQLTETSCSRVVFVRKLTCQNLSEFSLV